MAKYQYLAKNIGIWHYFGTSLLCNSSSRNLSSINNCHHGRLSWIRNSSSRSSSFLLIQLELEKLEDRKNKLEHRDTSKHRNASWEQNNTLELKNKAKMAKYHYLAKNIGIYHCLRII